MYRLAQRYGHAYGYVATARDLLESPQLRHRRFFVEMEHPVAGSVTMPGAPFRMSRTPLVTRRAPLLGEHDDSPLPSRNRRTDRGTGHEEGHLPLEGLRVVDFTHIWAGPYCTRILADLGAEVIKVESPRRGDGGRGKGVGRYHAYSRNKLAIAMDLRTEEGQRHIRKLISVSDVVVENFSVGVTGRLGVDYEDCRMITPGIVYVALPAFGRTGPESGFVGMGATQEAMSGLLSISSYPGAVPSPTGVKYGDPNGGMLAAVAVLAAIHHRASTGEGQLIDLSQREANIFTLPELVLDYAMNGRTAEAIGDKRPDARRRDSTRARTTSGSPSTSRRTDSSGRCARSWERHAWRMTDGSRHRRRENGMRMNSTGSSSRGRGSGAPRRSCVCSRVRECPRGPCSPTGRWRRTSISVPEASFSGIPRDEYTLPHRGGSRRWSWVLGDSRPSWAKTIFMCSETFSACRRTTSGR